MYVCMYFKYVCRVCLCVRLRVTLCMFNYACHVMYACIEYDVWALCACVCMKCMYVCNVMYVTYARSVCMYECVGCVLLFM